MSTAPVLIRQGPSLRIEELAITNFRTFRERTVIPFRGGAPEADALATFHGPNGSGKSNALAALDMFFLAVNLPLGQTVLKWDDPSVGAAAPLVISYRDRPTGAEGPTEIEVRFADARVGALRALFTPAGNHVNVALQGELELQTLHEMQAPFGPRSRPLAILDARRRVTWLGGKPGGDSSQLIKELYGLRTSRRVEERERWRTFVRTLGRFPMFQGREISVDLEAGQPNLTPILTFEERGRTVLALNELSSGEQQIVLLCALILIANAAIVAIQEPELSLDLKNAELLRDLLHEQIKAGLVDQIILESHVPIFDGASVIRFQRGADGTTTVSRERAVSEDALELSRKAKEQGAARRWVTSDGYTQIPEIMRKDLEVGGGKHVWFLKGPERWEVWPEDELNGMLGGKREGADG